MARFLSGPPNPNGNPRPNSQTSPYIYYLNSAFVTTYTMAIKKSELYSMLWASCDELRGGMDASQYKNYVLTLLFIKFVSDKYAGNPEDSIVMVPKGASFEDMVKLKGQPDIGDRINKEVLQPLFHENGLDDAIDLREVDFNDDERMGSGKEKVDRLSNLIEIFENPALNFRHNRAEDDDILGDAYEYLMRHFATESGKSKGQFYTPAEVSRVMARVIDVHRANRPSFSVYDPTCGSGSLLLKVAGESPHGLTIYGQEKDIGTRGLAVMNMWLHENPYATITGKNTLANPQFREADGSLKRFDFVVANPPFSTKNWNNGIVPMEDEFDRFIHYGVPPDKNGDYAFLLHIIASMKSTAKAAVILPHGVLFRGGAEANIRENVLRRGYIKGIIGLPANLFYGTGIPACIIVLDKEKADERNGIFMIDASKGFMKDGNKNRLREQDIHKIVDVFNKQLELPRFSRLVPMEEIVANEYNLNIPRYIDTQEPEDIQDLDAHLNGGIPNADIDSLSAFWAVYPSLKETLFAPMRPGYSRLKVEVAEVKATIFSHPEFTAYSRQLNAVFDDWKAHNLDRLRSIQPDTSPRQLIHELGEDLLERYKGKALIDAYDIYQHLMDFWNETMKDDVYLVVEDGWNANLKVVKKTRSEKIYDSDLLPKLYVVAAYLADQQAALQELEAQLEGVQARIAEYEEEHAGDEGLLEGAANDKGKLSKTNVKAYIKQIKDDPTEAEALALLKEVEALFDQDGELKKAIKESSAELEALTVKQYKAMTEADVQRLVIENKWLASLKVLIDSELDAISQRLANRVKELAERYASTLGELDLAVKGLEEKVAGHLEKMGVYGVG